MTRLARLKALLGRWPTRRERACLLKDKFGRERAKQEAARLRATTREDICEYKCSQCHSWHVGRANERRTATETCGSAIQSIRGYSTHHVLSPRGHPC